MPERKTRGNICPTTIYQANGKTEAGILRNECAGFFVFMAKKKKKTGAPAKWTSPEEMGKAIDRYFKDCPDTYPTITGLTLFLGFCDRQSFYDYEKKKEFSCTIKRGRTMVEREYEKLLHRPGCTGAIFALKNFGWRDDQEKQGGDDRLEEELEFVNVPKEGNSRFQRFYN